MSIVTSNAVFDPNFGIDAAQEGDVVHVTISGGRGVSPLRAAYGPWNAAQLKETWRDAVPEDGPVFPTPAAPATFLRTAYVQLLPIDLANGIRGNVWVDPVGLAIKRAIPFSRQVRVSTVDIAFTIGHPRNGTVEHVRYVVPTPLEVAAWIERWDAKKDVILMAFPFEWQEAE